MEPTQSNGAPPPLEKRLQDPDTRRVLGRVLDRLDTLERTLDALEQAPAVLQTTTDAVDQELTDAAERGVVVDERMREALTLAEKLTEPDTVEVLSGLIDRLDQLEHLADLAEQGGDAAKIAADSLDEVLTEAAERGVVVDERAREGLVLLEKLTEPDTAAALGRLLDRSAQLNRLADLAEAAPDALATVVDILDSEYARIAERGMDPERTLRRVFRSLGRFGEVLQSDEFDALLDSGVLDPEALDAVGRLGSALAESQQEADRDDIPRKGLFGLIGALRDPDVQQAIGFVTTLAKKFGRALRDA